jgi:hypothetical protein
MFLSYIVDAQMGTNEWRMRGVKSTVANKLKTETTSKPNKAEELVIEGKPESVIVSAPTYLNGYYKLVVTSSNMASYEVQDDGKWINYLPLNDFKLDGDSMYIGRGMFTADFERFYFSACDTNNSSNCGIYFSSYDYGKDKWKQPQQLLFDNNTLKSITPFILTENKIDKIYFAGSEDGKQYDLYFTEFDNEGKCKKQPEKIKGLPELKEGSRIAPFVEQEGEDILFIYYSEREGGEETDYDINKYEIGSNKESEELDFNTAANETFYFIKPKNEEEKEPKLIFFMSDAGNTDEEQMSNHPGKIYIIKE